MNSDKPDYPLPKHVAFIMDGNGRWAEKRLLPRAMGHKEGVKRMKRVVSDCVDMGIEIISFYAFSTENRFRPQSEVDALKKLIRDNVYEMMKELMERGVKVRFMGDLEYFEEDIREILKKVESDSRDGKLAVVNIGLNYGSRDEIVRAVNACVERGEKVDIDSFSRMLDTALLPDPDIIIRTGGEMRLSNFMLFQAAYSELAVTKTLWPDFDRKELMKILEDFSKRNRRFGKV